MNSLLKTGELVSQSQSLIVWVQLLIKSPNITNDSISFTFLFHAYKISLRLVETQLR